jgi:hypothetical protein
MNGSLFGKLFRKPGGDMRVAALSRKDWERELPQLIRLRLVKTGETYEQYLETLRKCSVLDVPKP